MARRRRRAVSGDANPFPFGGSAPNAKQRGVGGSLFDFLHCRSPAASRRFPRKRGKGSELMRAAVASLALTDFRSYERAELSAGRAQRLPVRAERGGQDQSLGGDQPVLARPRHARAPVSASSGRRLPDEAQGRAWAVSADDRGRGGRGAARHRRRDGRRGAAAWCGSAARPSPPGRLAEHLRPLWLTPAQDRLFLEGAAERRRFFDRLVFAAEPIHAAHAGAYERALRERTRLLAEAGRRSGLAERAGGPHGRGRRADRRGARGDARGAAGRDRRARRPAVSRRPTSASPARSSSWRWPARRHRPRSRRGWPPIWPQSRARDAAAGRALSGPHRADLAVDPPRARPAGGRMLDRRAESADFEPGFGPGGATFACEIATESYIIAG